MRRRVRMVTAIVPLLFCWTLLLMPHACWASGTLPQQRAAVAVWDFDDLSPVPLEEGMGELLAGQVIEVLTERGEEVVERQRLLLALEEQRIGSSELADEETRLRVGRVIGARRMVFGSVLAVGPQTRIDVRLVEVETGAVLKAVQKTVESGGVAASLEAVRRAAEELEPAPH